MCASLPTKKCRGHSNNRNETSISEKTTLNVHLISDFNLATLGQYLSNDGSEPQLSSTLAPFAQVFPSLLQPERAGLSDFAVVWTSPEKTLPTFAEVLTNATVSEEQLVSEVRQFADCLKQAQKHFRAIFVVSWTLPSYYRGNGIMSLKGLGTRKLLLK